MYETSVDDKRDGKPLQTLMERAGPMRLNTSAPGKAVKLRAYRFLIEPIRGSRLKPSSRLCIGLVSIDIHVLVFLQEL